MIIISTREFRSNQKKYLDLVDKNEQVVIQRKGTKAYVLAPVTEQDRFFMDPRNLEEVRKGIEEHKNGQTRPMNKAEIDNLLGV